MGCVRFDPDEDGEGWGWMCGAGVPGPCSVCGLVADHLCDFPMGKGNTCDAMLCEVHAMKAPATAPAVDDVTARREPAKMRRQKKQQATLDEIEFCPAHFAIAQRR